jgi:hypothetical protein
MVVASPVKTVTAQYARHVVGVARYGQGVVLQNGLAEALSDRQ